MKKNYKPKEDKVKKLEKVYTETKLSKVVKCEIFTKSVKLILVALLFTGCSAQWHLEKALKKDPSIITTKIVKVKDTLIIRESYQITDTFTTRVLDTIIIEDENVKTIVYRNHDVIRLKTIVKGDTIKVTQTIYKPIVKVKECQQSWWVYVILLITLVTAFIISRKV